MSCACAVAAYLGFAFLEAVPQTIHFKQVEWNSSTPTEIHSVSGVRANSADGSQATWADRKTLGFLANEEHVGRSIYTRNPHIAYLIDDEERTVRVIPCTCEWETHPPPLDGQCLGAAKEYDPDLVFIGWSRVAGVPTVRYRKVSLSDYAEVSFAPSIRCEMLEELTIVFGIGLEKSYTHLRVTEYIPGEADRNVFSPPQAYIFKRDR